MLSKGQEDERTGRDPATTNERGLTRNRHTHTRCTPYHPSNMMGGRGAGWVAGGGGGEFIRPPRESSERPSNIYSFFFFAWFRSVPLACVRGPFTFGSVHLRSVRTVSIISVSVRFHPRSVRFVSVRFHSRSVRIVSTRSVSVRSHLVHLHSARFRSVHLRSVWFHAPPLLRDPPH